MEKKTLDLQMEMMRGSRDFPMEIVFEILLRLPVRCVCRFKCVCIRWRNTIDSDEFREQHFASQNNSALFRFYDYTDNSCDSRWEIFCGENLTIVEHLNTPEPKHFARVVGPCRGSLFLVHRRFVKPDASDPALYNPMTRAYRRFPSIPYEAKKSLTSYVYGLGWDPYSNDYKVVFFYYCDQVALVYTFSTDSWRYCPEIADDKIRAGCYLSHLPVSYIHINGFFYWLSKFQDHPLIVCFDVAQEVFTTLVVPYNIPTVYGYVSSISTYHDLLAFLAYQEGEDFEVWVLQRQHSWTKFFSFTSNCTPIYSVEGIWKDTHVLLKTKGRQGYAILVLYDISNHETVEVDTGGSDCDVFLNYKENLFWVKGDGSPLATS